MIMAVVIINNIQMHVHISMYIQIILYNKYIHYAVNKQNTYIYVYVCTYTKCINNTNNTTVYQK